MNAIEELDTLIDQLAGGQSPEAVESPEPDAIDRELAAEPRRTAVRSMRESAVMTRFRRELTDGLVRADTVASVLRLLRDVLPRILSGGA